MLSTKTKLERQLFRGESVVADSGLLPQVKLAEVGISLPLAAGLGPVLVSDGKYPILAHVWSPPKRSVWLDVLESQEGLVIGCDLTGALMLASALRSHSDLTDFLKQCSGNGFVSGRRGELIYAAALVNSFFKQV